VRILVWHVHGSYATALVSGRHEYVVPVTPDRGPDGRGRARTWDWPTSVREVSPGELRAEHLDAVVLQRPEELALVRAWTGREPGGDLPAVYLEHDAPTGPAAQTVHLMADQTRVPIVHVTHFNAVMWDNGRAPTRVVEHGVPDPGHRYTGEWESVAVAVNEPVRRGRVAGTDLMLALAAQVPLEVYGMGMAALAELAVAAGVPDLAGHLHDDPPQSVLHAHLARHRAYLHPFRWTSLGLSLIEAMLLGMPVLALSTTAAPESVPPAAGVLSCDPAVLAATARRWLGDPAEARACGDAARAHALSRFSLDRFLADWDAVLGEIAADGGSR